MARFRVVVAAISTALLLVLVVPGARAQSASANVRVTGGSYVSADEMGGTGTYTDAVLQRCGTDRRQQNEPTLAIDPRNTNVWTAGSNDYCTIPTVGDAWPGIYRSTDAGATWAHSLLPAYKGDTSPQGQSSPVASIVATGAVAGGDPLQAWDQHGNLFFMGNNFNRGIANGNSARTRNDTGDIWLATYAPSDPNDSSTDGARYARTVLLVTNVPGNGQSNDKTGLGVDPVTENVYTAWSDFHGSGCNSIFFSRSTDHGASFSAPMKISDGICGNQGPYFAFGPQGQVYIAWQGTTGGSFGQHGTNGAAFVASTDHGVTFSKPRLVSTYTAFVSTQFSGNGARQCGDAPFDCPSGQTFPRFDLAGPSIATDNQHGTIVLAFQRALADGQGQIASVVSNDGGSTWSDQTPIAASATGHQFFPWIAASAGRVSAIWYDSRDDADYAATRAPCNTPDGAGTACLNVRYAESTDGGTTWQPSVQITDAQTNPNMEQFGGRHTPFFGDYITVAAVGDTIGAVWTDQRDAVVGSDASGDNDNNDAAGDPETGGTCTSISSTCFDSSGGLDQNIYSATITP